MIIPQSKYLLLNEQKYIFSNQECQEITVEDYLCREFNPIEIDNNVPCEIRLLRYSEDIEGCGYVHIKASRTEIRKLEKNKWIVIAPNKTIATVQCGHNTDNVPILGTYMIEANDVCEVNIGPFKIKSYQNSSPEFKVIALPHLDFTTRFSNQTSNFPSIKLESINLDEFRHIKAALELQTKQLETIPDGVTNYFQNPNVWTIVLYVAITLGFCLFLEELLSKEDVLPTREMTKLPIVHTVIPGRRSSSKLLEVASTLGRS